MNANVQKSDNKKAAPTRSRKAPKEEAISTSKATAPPASVKTAKATAPTVGFKEGDEVIFGMPKGQQTRGTFSHCTAQGKLTIKTLEPRGKKKTWPPGTVVHWPAENVHRA